VFSFWSPHEIGLNTRAGKLLLCCTSVVDCDSFYECLFPNANNENLEINPFAVIFPACTMTLFADVNDTLRSWKRERASSNGRKYKVKFQSSAAMRLMIIINR